jgi:hypothetical protein
MKFSKWPGPIIPTLDLYPVEILENEQRFACKHVNVNYNREKLGMV